jgi:hypothetical protein
MVNIMDEDIELLFWFILTAFIIDILCGAHCGKKRKQELIIRVQAYQGGYPT